MSLGHIMILGSEHRGIWLAEELVQKGFKVTWISKGEAKFVQGPWQIGSTNKIKNLPKSAQEFLAPLIKYQEGFQILTPKGIFDFSKEFLEPSLNSFFDKESSLLLEKYLNSCKKDASELRAVLNSKIKVLSKSKRWVWDWMEELNKKRQVPGNYAPVTLDNYAIFSETVKLDLKKQSTIHLHSNVQILGVGFDGWRVTGVELGSQGGFISCDELILSCSARSIFSINNEISKKFKFLGNNTVEPEYVWMSVDFKMKSDARPSGMPEYSSFVVDPFLPYESSGFGMMKWGKDKITVWSRLKPEQIKIQSVVESWIENLKKNLSKLIACFDDHFIEAAITTLEPLKDVSSYVFSSQTHFLHGRYRKNIWIAGPELDKELDLVSSINTEQAILSEILIKYRKELSVDRTLHPPRDGENLEQNQSV